MDRRKFLAGAAGALASGGVPVRAATDSPFAYGIASGDSTATSVVIWTAIDGGGGGHLEWRVRGADDGSLIRSGVASVSAEGGRTAHVLVDGLEADRAYHYEFVHRGVVSTVGRTRTLPAQGRRPVRFAVFSCSRYSSGWFHAYRHAAEDRSIDFALHLGDYIYEGGNAPDGQARIHHPDHELFTLGDYRARHAQHKADPDLQALHAAMPMLAIWDDHEFADDASRDGSHTSRPAFWTQRAIAARQAYFEWMPMLPNATGGLWRSKRIGDLADLYLLDTRIEGRADQLSPDDAAFRSAERDMLGPAQERWLSRSLASPAKPWTVMLSSVIFSQIVWPDSVRAHFGGSGPAWGQQLLEKRIADSTLGAGNPDAWDGYPAAQKRLMGMLSDRSGRALILSGDTHSSWSFHLPGKESAPIGWEIGVPSVTTEASLDALSGSPEDIEALFRNRNPLMDYLHASARGYVVVEIDEAAAQIEWRYVSSVTAQEPTWRVGKRLRFPAR
ncbi:MAG: hypothetical protein CVT77_01280 [Alphaproteobacteria bacterium HGW-Alphaproteobacteria-16]|nr:MAG: hypothetical protein CVT77_01280 [Alphaproteobacteria bacterium HGW-Alphaproteobacteria-16]